MIIVESTIRLESSIWVESTIIVEFVIREESTIRVGAASILDLPAATDIQPTAPVGLLCQMIGKLLHE